MKWIGAVLLILLAAVITMNIVNGSSETLNEARAQRDSAKADRDGVLLVADSLARAAADSATQKVTDSLKAINHTADTILIVKVRYLAPKVAHADSVAPFDTTWRPVALEALQQRDSAIVGWNRADQIIARQDTTLERYRQSIFAWRSYQDKAEARISQLESWQEDQLRGFKLFGKIPLPKLQITYGFAPTNSFHPELVAGLGYTVNLKRRHPAPASRTPSP